MATGYVANWGNDDNDGLSWDKPYRTIFKARSTGKTPIYIRGLFNEIADTLAIIGTSPIESIMDGTLLTIFQPNIQGNTLTNVQVKNFTAFSSNNRYFRNVNNCIFHNIGTINTSTLTNMTEWHNNLIYGMLSTIYLCQRSNTYFSYNTINVNLIFFSLYSFEINNLAFSNSIFKSVNVYFQININPIYCLFIGNAFQFRGGGLGYDETVYSYPTGSTDTEKLENLRLRMVIVYGGLTEDYLIGCAYYSGSYNDIFVDADNGDYHLTPNCIAAHMNYDGDYIGAMVEGAKADWDVDFSGVTNIDTYGNITDQTLDASGYTLVQDIGHIRKIVDISVLGDRAKRNGQSINVESDLGVNIYSGSNVLTTGKTYQCQINTVIIDNSGVTTLNPYECYYPVDEGGGAGLGFSGEGVMREVLIDRYPEKMQFKFHRTDPTLVSANLITCYIARDDNHVMVNVDGLGDPLYGDADLGYNVGTAVILSARYWQAFPLITSLNLAAR